MEIKYLKLIKTIAEHGNISKSANILFLTQSALSHQLREIETRLGFKIFIRSRNNWTLTREGDELYQLANKVISEIEIGLNKIQNIKNGSSGEIRISTECYTFYHGLPKFIQKMGMLYPEIKIDLLIEATHNPISKLLNKELDLAIVTTKIQNEALKNIDLFEDEIFAIMHAEHPLADNIFLKPSDFKTLHLIIHSYPLETVAVHQHFLKQKNIIPNKITAIPLTEIALELVNSNMGVMCIPKWGLEMFKIPKTLQLKQIGKNGLKRKHSLILRKEDKDKKYIQDFSQNLVEEFLHFT